MKPSPIDYAPYYAPYVEKLPFDQIQVNLKHSLEFLHLQIQNMNAAQSLKAYAPGKWSGRAIIQHIIDSERVFSYRAMGIARGDSNFPSFDQDDYVRTANADYRDWDHLKQELKIVRESTILLFESFGELQLKQKGIMAGNSVTVNALGFITAGHMFHHAQVIEQKYKYL